VTRAGLLAAAGVAAAALVAAGPVAVAPAATARPVPAVTGHLYPGLVSAVPPTTARCRRDYGLDCYSPRQFATAYGIDRAWANGYAGRGRTIVVVTPFGSPTIRRDLSTFNAAFGLPEPPSFRILSPVGEIPPYDDSAERYVWALEATLDVQYAHAMAPEADLVLVTTPVAETQGVTGFPEIVAAENHVIDRGIGDVISQSFGATEPTFRTRRSLVGLRSSFVNARRHGVTVLAASGDNGATGRTRSGGLYPYRVSLWPATDPLVTAVGGTRLQLDAAGRRTAPDEVWNDGSGAGGGGRSMFFQRPEFQDVVRSVVGDRRGTPDLSMSAAIDGAAVVYHSFSPGEVGYHLVGGTSLATPMFAGVVAIAAQQRGARLGAINPALYELGRSGLRTGIVDVTRGSTTYGGVRGFPATPGYDLASGWGTVDAAEFATALGQQVGGRDLEGAGGAAGAACGPGCRATTRP
jgi:subtilase family serine protease